MHPKRIHLKIVGRVQGVCFRAYAQEEAMRLALTGWVCNREDGSVELIAEGSETALRELIIWCGVGPPYAKVTRVEPQWEEASGEFHSFTIRHY